MTEPREQQQPAPPRLSSLRRDLDRLTHEAESLAASFGRESRLAREEAVGAELLATRDLVAHLGIAWDTAAQLGDVYARQFRYFLEDHAATLTRLLDGSARGSVAELLGDHLERRVSHVNEGVNEGIDVLSRQAAAAGAALETLWAPFVAVVRQDWSGRRARDT